MPKINYKEEKSALEDIISQLKAELASNADDNRRLFLNLVRNEFELKKLEKIMEVDS
jgi:hypothetical protein